MERGRERERGLQMDERRTKEVLQIYITRRNDVSQVCFRSWISEICARFVPNGPTKALQVEVTTGKKSVKFGAKASFGWCLNSSPE